MNRTARRARPMALPVALLVVAAFAVSASPAEAAQKAIVTDLDLTLGLYTVCSSSWNCWLNPPYIGAKADLKAFANNGYSVLYLSCKSSSQSAQQKTWLNYWGFPAGDSLAIGGLLGCSDTVKQKCDVIKQYQAKGWVFHFGFSEEDSNMQAYRCAGVHHPTKVTSPFWWTTVSYSSLEAGHTA